MPTFPRRLTPALLALTAALGACSTGHGAAPAPTPPPSPSHHRQTQGLAVRPATAVTLTPKATTAKPNVVLVLTDDLDASLVSYMPTVQSMEKDGTTFAHYVVTDSLCCPSRASLFTGEFPHDTGVFTNLGYDGGYPAFHKHADDQSTVATDLQARGYRTALYGKYLNGYLPQGGQGQTPDAVPPGWSDWAVADNGYPQYDYTLATGHGLEKHGHEPQDFLTDVIARKAHGFIGDAAAKKQPFFLEVAPFSPHAPYTPAPRDAADFPGLTAPRTASFDAAPGATQPRWLKARKPLLPRQLATIDKAYRLRAQAVQSIDDMLAGIRAQLKALGIARNTYVVFTSDNGLHLGQHRLPPGKETAFDTDIQVPLVVTGPGVARGHQTEGLASNIDLRPTVDRIAGVRVPAAVDGRSLLPLLGGGVGPRQAVLVEHHGPHGGPGDPDVPANVNSPDFVLPTAYEAIRLRNEVWVEYVDGEVEHYDTATDPEELHEDSASLTPQHRATLHTLLTELEKCHGHRACTAADHTSEA